MRRLHPICGIDVSGMNWAKWLSVSKLPIHDARIVIAGLYRSTDMGIDPERPKSVIQIESDQFREREAIGERCGGHG